jgi:glycosyltransferase involved in cell wall biosynthesis
MNRDKGLSRGLEEVNRENAGKRVVLFSHASDLSGAPIALARLASRLPQYGFSPLVLLPGPGPLSGKLERQGTEYKVLKGPFKLVAFMKVLRQEDPVLVHVNSLVKSWPVLVSRMVRRPVVWHVHEFLGTKKLYAAIIHAVSDGVILISKEQFALFRGKKKACRIPNGIDTESYEKVRPSGSVPKKAAKGGKTNILFIGRIEPNKGLFVLAKAAAIIDGRERIRYIVVGGVPRGGGRYEEQVKAFLRQEGLESSFVFLGYRQDVPEIIAACDLLCQPSYSDTFPLTVLEAMASGLPVIGTSVGEVPSVIDEGITGFIIEPGDPESLADRIKKLGDDPDLRKSMGIEGKTKVKKEYEIGIHAGRVAEFYNKVLARDR